MITVSAFQGRKVAVFGLARSGITAALALAAGGADVACWDDGTVGREAATKAGLSITDLTTADWSPFAALVLAPGVPLTHPKPHWTVAAARAAGVEVIGDIELFLRERAISCPDAPVIAITGTNGKSTTTALVAHLLAAQGIDVAMGGNIGVGVLSLPPPALDRVHVLELSSFQIDLTPSLKPTVGVLLNVSADHLDRHGTLDHYAAIKARLVQEADTACIGIDDPVTRGIAEQIAEARPADSIYAFTVGKGTTLVPKLYAIGQSIFSHEKEGAYAASREIADLSEVESLRGTHNVQNALAALSALRALQDRLHANRGAGAMRVFDAGQLARHIASFPGLAHRMENLGRVGRALYVNDSKATNADSTEKALASFPRDIFWILGGVAKEGGIVPLAAYFDRIAKAYLIGDASDAFAATLGAKVPFERCGTLATAVAMAGLDAAAASRFKSPIVLLSPACASYDQFKSFEHRGDAFKALVAKLPGFAPMTGLSET